MNKTIEELEAEIVGIRRHRRFVVPIGIAMFIALVGHLLILYFY